MESQLRGPRVAELLTANYTFLNERLARNYGIPVSTAVLPSVTERSKPHGIAWPGSVLTSRRTRTASAPCARQVDAELPGAPPPPPPPNVPASKPPACLPDLTVRELLEEHRKTRSARVAMPAWISGFALEN